MCPQMQSLPPLVLAATLELFAPLCDQDGVIEHLDS